MRVLKDNKACNVVLGIPHIEHFAEGPVIIVRTLNGKLHILGVFFMEVTAKLVFPKPLTFIQNLNKAPSVDVRNVFSLGRSEVIHLGTENTNIVFYVRRFQRKVSLNGTQS